MEKQKRFGEKNKQGPQHKSGPDVGPNKPRKDPTQKLPNGPSERSDEESIGRPVQLDKDQQPGLEGAGHRDDRPRNEPAVV